MNLRELDVKVATDILGWRRIGDKYYPMSGNFNGSVNFVNGVPDRLPRFSTSKNSAVILMRIMMEREKEDGKVDFDNNGEEWTCVMDMKSGYYTATAKTFPVAMILCCFKMAKIEMNPEDIDYADDQG